MVKKGLISSLGLLGICSFVFLLLITASRASTENITQVVHDTSTQNIFICHLCHPMTGGSCAMLFSDPVADSSQSEVKRDGHVFTLKREEYPGCLWFGDFTPLHGREKYTVRLTSNIGNCDGSIIMPGALSILQPKDCNTLSAYHNVYSEWSSAPGADFYYICYHAEGYNSHGDLVGICEYIEDFITSTSYAIPISYFDIRGTTYYGVNLSVIPCAGPLPEPNTDGNMTGDVTGFLTALGEGDCVWSYLGKPAKSEHRMEMPGIGRYMDTYLKVLQLVREKEVTPPEDGKITEEMAREYINAQRYLLKMIAENERSIDEFIRKYGLSSDLSELSDSQFRAKNKKVVETWDKLVEKWDNLEKEVYKKAGITEEEYNWIGGSLTDPINKDILNLIAEELAKMDRVVPKFSITPNSVGLIKIGDTKEEVHMKMLSYSHWIPQWTDSRLLVLDPSTRREVLVVDLDNHDKVYLIYVITSQFITAEGIHVGSTLGDAERAYGKARIVSGEGEVFAVFNNKAGIHFHLPFDYLPCDEHDLPRSTEIVMIEVSQ